MGGALFGTALAIGIAFAVLPMEALAGTWTCSECSGDEHMHEVTVGSGQEITSGTFNNFNCNEGTISGGYFYSDIENGDSADPFVSRGTIEGGTFYKNVTNYEYSTITNGTFYGTVTDKGEITGGAYDKEIPGNGTVDHDKIRPIPVALEKTADGGTNAEVYTHTHTYVWTTVREADLSEDGVEEYRCSCGDVQERCVIPASETAVKGLFGEIKNAPQNGTATFDIGRLYTLSDYVIKKLAERTDVTTVITFEYQNQAYQMTIPAGADFTGLLADEDYFYGYFFFANAVGATIEAI